MDGSNDEGGHDSSERWLVSYADFITLLFALFVLLYALSMQSAQKENRSWVAMATAVGARPTLGGLRPELGEAARGGVDPMAIPRQDLKQLVQNVQATMRKFPAAGLNVRVDPRGVIISLAAAKFFASGAAAIAPAQTPVLADITKILDPLKNAIEIDGFTDSNPIADARFHDNWELSAARAAAVLHYLLDHSTINPSQFTIAGYGPFKPIADNRTDAGRALNRRVEIVIRPQQVA